MMSQEKELPKGWEVVKLDELIVRMTNGANAIQYEEKVGLPISRIETIWNESIDLKRVKYIKENESDFIEKYRLHDNDILFSHINSDSHLGKTALFKISKTTTLIHGINLLLLRPTPEVSAELLNYQFKYLRYRGAFAAVAQKAVNQSSINQAKLKGFDFFLPPLPEQHRIVSKIEELFSSLEKGIESLKTAQAQLKVYRQAVLKSVFESIPNANQVNVEDCCTHVVDCLHSTAKFKESGFYCVDTTCIRDGKILFDQIRYVDEETFQERISRLKPQHGDILFAREGTVGTTVIVPKDVEICLGQRMMMFRLKKEIRTKYFMYFFQSSIFKSQYRPLIGGTTSPHLNIRDIRKFFVLTCSPEEQEKAIIEIESRLSVCDKIEENISVSLLQAEALRQSILKKAFEGKLVPQDPNDEAAAVLLERVRGVREKVGKKSTHKKER